jgi:hypothetical protein
MLQHDINVIQICEQKHIKRRRPVIIKRSNESSKYTELESILGKRSYSDSMGYNNDYNIVQDADPLFVNDGVDWVDAYIENLRK